MEKRLGGNMYKKMIFGLVASVLALGFTNFGLNAQAEEVEGSVWVESSESAENTDVAAPSDDTVIEEIDVEEEIEEEPDMWPVYLSFGAIGVTFLLIIIINLSGRRYNKK